MGVTGLGEKRWNGDVGDGADGDGRVCVGPRVVGVREARQWGGRMGRMDRNVGRGRRTVIVAVASETVWCSG